MTTRKPRWQDDRNGGCQWPKCREEGDARYAVGATKWIDRDVWLCTNHQNMMGMTLWPEASLPFGIGAKITIMAFEDFPEEEVYLRDWFLAGDEITLLVSDDPDSDPDDCQEVPAHLIVQCQGS